MLGFLRTGLSEEEIREFGRVYEQENTARATASVFPATLTERTIDQGYEFADLARDVPALRGESGTQPNLNVVALDHLEDGADPDSPEFVAALGNYGYDVTLVTASDHHDTAGEEPETAATRETVVMELRNFRCIRESSEWSGSDEIYFSTAASSDG
ncbi:hypothetical protein ACFWNE_33390 [Streptomyces goshikiensis]|uniref:hypothetical protein n=1 Tax=Streptomyces goshikiensis TaxID=1942 RepID=UPI00365B01F1